MMNKRVIMYDVSNGDRRFDSATNLPTGVKDASTLVYNATISLFPDINNVDLNIMMHGNIITSCVVDKKNGVITSIKPLISSICEDIELCSNGNIIYRDTWIIRFGDVGSKDKYGYAIATIGKTKDGGSFRCFPSVDEAYDFIDKTK